MVFYEVSVPFTKVYRINNYMENRLLCPICQHRPVAVNYVKEGKKHYRSRCDQCIRKNKKLKPQAPAWFRFGYRKKECCERCGFNAASGDQLNVFHVDGNLKNNDHNNLKTICLNCTQEVYRGRLPWKSSPSVAGF
jgi:hypothetical protein